MRPLAWVVLLSLAALMTGCKGPCRQLSEKLCDCSTGSLDRDACLRRASSEEARVVITAEHEDACEALIPVCDCNTIDTPEGKARCGLSRAP